MTIGFDAKRAFHNQTGLGNYSRDLIRGLLQHFPQYLCLGFNPKPSDLDPFFGYTQFKEILPESWFGKTFSGFWRQRSVLGQIKAQNLDVFHGLSGELPIGIEKLNLKKVVTIHDLIFLRFPHLYSFFDRKIHYYKFLHAAKVADKIIAISDQTKKDIIEYLKVDPSKIQVVFQSCHPVFKSKIEQEKIESTLEKYQLPKEYVLCVGTLEPRKNGEILLEALKELSYTLVFVGSGKNYKNELVQKVKDYKMTHRVHFLEKVGLEELACLYQGAAVFCYPSFFEGFGIPILEALYSGTPVITSNVSCLPEAAGPDSICLDPTDANAWEKQIDRLMKKNPELRKIQAEKGRIYAQNFDTQKVMTNLSDLYQDLVS
ncbi:MAG: glycosyl transferase family 1 [Flavobacteriaceae bacterium]|nr:MAG: glycosyl transferase family 1 [Flavobacteriaceae bacterium]